MTSRTLSLFVIALLILFTACEDNDPVDDWQTNPTELECNITSPLTLKNNPDLPVDYIVNCLVTVNAELTIEAGTVIEFASEAGLSVIESTNATINAQGTSAEPIIMKGTADVVGLWKGIRVQSNNPINALSHTHISNAGSSSFNGADIQSPIKVDGKLKIQNCVIKNSPGTGIYVGSWAPDDAIAGFSGNIIENCGKYPIEIALPQLQHIDATSIYNANQKNKIYVYPGGTLTDDHVWQNMGIPVLMDNDVYVGYGSDPGSLSIREGAEIHFMTDAAIRINSNGYLDISGTAANPVLLRGEVAAPGAWKGIFVLSNDLRNSIHGTILSHGGGSSHNGSAVQSLIRLGTVGSCCSSAKLTISESTLSHTDCIYHLYDSEDVRLTEIAVIKETYINEYCE